MIPYGFNYLRPKSLVEARAMFADAPDARYLAGGQTLIPAMKQRLASPSDLIDLADIDGFLAITRSNGTIVVGAGARHADVGRSAEIQDAIPALAHLAGMIGDPAVRHMGTIGGSLANNDPAADYPAAVLALGAVIETTDRRVPANTFFRGLFETALEPGEIIRTISFPIPRRAAYAKFPNPASRYALVGVFVAETTTGVRVAVTGAGPCVFRADTMEAALSKRFDSGAIENIGIDAEGLNSDLHASAEYRAHLVTVMAKRAVKLAQEQPHP